MKLSPRRWRRPLLASLRALGVLCALGGCATDNSGASDQPLGGPCAASGDCASGLCIRTGGDPYCTEPCPNGLCPDGYLCIQSPEGPVCAEDLSAQPVEALTCSAIVTCTANCAEQSCFDACSAQGSAQAQGLFDAVISCVQSRCPGGDANCQQSQCGAELAACFGDEGGGEAPVPEGACQAIDRCVYAQCADQTRVDQGCAQGCVDQAAAGARAQYQAVADCVSTECAAGEDASCLITRCAAAYQTCFPPGMTDCEGILECAMTCADYGCQRICQQGGTLEAQRVFLIYADCFYRNDCVTVDGCPACAAELDSCR